jgi:hypothetical protein
LDNQAIYGPDIASYPKEIQIEFVYKNDTENESTVDEDKGLRRLQNGSSSFPPIVPGVPFSFLIYILD